MIKLGSKVRDIISGYTGIATARVEYLYGCARIMIEPEGLNNDNEPLNGLYFDEQRVEIIEERKPIVSSFNSATTGGPQKSPSRQKLPPN